MSSINPAQLRRLKSEHATLVNTTKQYLTDPKSNDNNYYMETLEIPDLRNFEVLLRGPPGTPYVGGCFKLVFEIPPDFPFKPPKVKFATPIYHPNIDDRGNICLDTLSKSWTPALSIEQVILTIMALLETPNPADPLSPTIATEFVKDYMTFLLNATEKTKTATAKTKDQYRTYMTDDAIIAKAGGTCKTSAKSDDDDSTD
jgi:ubiquitin-conjugating enzyme E2 D/E